MKALHYTVFGTPSGKRRRGAFTLTELLVSLVVVAVLFGFLLPSVVKVRERSQETACIANLRQLGIAVNLYAADNRLELPPGNSDGSEWFKLYTGSWLRKYGGNDEVEGVKKQFRCPGDKTRPPITDYQYYYSYTWNSHLLQAYVGGVPAHGRTPVKVADVQRKLLFADAITNGENPTLTAKYPAALTSDNGNDRVSSRHHGGANCLFGDGSVQWLKKEAAINPLLIQR